MAISKALIEGNSARNLPQTQVFNLSTGLSLKQLADNLSASVNTRRPSSRLTIWGGRRQLEKQDLDLVQQRQLLEEINALGLTAQAMAQTQAELFLIPELMQAIITGKRWEWEVNRARFLSQIKEFEDQAKMRQLEMDKQRLEIARAQTDIRIAVERHTAELEQLQLTGYLMSEKQKAELEHLRLQGGLMSQKQRAEIENLRLQGALMANKQNADIYKERYEAQLMAEKQHADIIREQVASHISLMLAIAEQEARMTETKANKARVSMLKKLKNEMDFNNISPSQAFVLAKALNPSDSLDIDFQLKEEMFKEELQKAREHNRRLKKEVDLVENNIESQIRENGETRGGFGND